MGSLASLKGELNTMQLLFYSSFDKIKKATEVELIAQVQLDVTCILRYSIMSPDISKLQLLKVCLKSFDRWFLFAFHHQGGGCGLMTRTRKFEQIVNGMNSVSMIFLYWKCFF